MTLQAPHIQEKFIGPWRLVHSIEIKPDGSIHYPFGEDAIGYITYTSAGLMNVHIMRTREASTEECLRIARDYLAYFGRYNIDTVNQAVHHFVEGSLFPNIIGETLTRRYEFIGNQLSLKPVDDTHREILWEKIT